MSQLPNNAFDFGEDTDKPAPTHEALQGLNDLVKAAITADKEAQEAATVASAKKAAYDRIMLELIPSAMDALGMQKFVTTSGFEVSVKEDITHSLAAERKEAGLNWLEENGHGSVIKSNLVLTFAKGKEAESQKVLDELRAQHPDLPIEKKRDVHSATLKSLIKQLMEGGVQVPVDIFKIFKVRKATIK